MQPATGEFRGWRATGHRSRLRRACRRPARSTDRPPVFARTPCPGATAEMNSDPVAAPPEQVDHATGASSAPAGVVPHTARRWCRFVQRRPTRRQVSGLPRDPSERPLTRGSARAPSAEAPHNKRGATSPVSRCSYALLHVGLCGDAVQLPFWHPTALRWSLRGLKAYPAMCRARLTRIRPNSATDRRLQTLWSVGPVGRHARRSGSVERGACAWEASALVATAACAQRRAWRLRLGNVRTCCDGGVRTAAGKSNPRVRYGFPRRILVVL